MATDLTELQNRLWEAADQLRGISGLRASEYSAPVLGLIFLSATRTSGSRPHTKSSTAKARVGAKLGPLTTTPAASSISRTRLAWSTSSDCRKAPILARRSTTPWRQLSARTPTSNGVLPRAYAGLPNAVLVELLRLLGRLPDSIEGDGFGLIHEHFLGQFAFAEGQKGGSSSRPRPSSS